ncbi:MAG: hypothetical protein Q9212_002031 [Teloschistes hypoglaucus]
MRHLKGVLLRSVNEYDGFKLTAYLENQIYRDQDKPLYRRGNKILLGLIAWNIVLVIGSKAYYSHRNASREKVWQAMSQEEKAHYLTTTTDEGNKRLDFRFVH